MVNEAGIRRGRKRLAACLRVFGWGLMALAIVAPAALAAPPADPPHDDFKDGFGHARDKKKPFTSHCTDCHAPDLRGGWGPSCYQCHGEKWDKNDVSNLAPPLDHTILKGGFALHKPGFGTPLANGCTLCHGSNLNNGFAPSCYSCHTRIWAGEGPPADHTANLNGAAHKPGYNDPFGNNCTQCHGPNLNDGFAPSCYSCHTPPDAPHDFTGQPWIDPADSACTPCHDWGNWNHAFSPTTNYTVTDHTLSLVGNPTGVSTKCLGCHEGNVAVDDFLGTLSNPPSSFLTGSTAFGSDLTHHHPVSFPFDTALAAAHGGLNDPATMLSGLTPSGTIAQDMLDSGQLQCTTCHDPHDNTNGGFLVKAATGSTGLCFTCHKETVPAGTLGMHHIPRRDDPWGVGSCTMCHGADLSGAGPAPACAQCHNPFVFPDTPPSGHHGKDRYDPLNNCTVCHGANLTGGTYNGQSTPSCFQCHTNLWQVANQPPTVDTGGPYAANVGQTVLFDGSGSSDPDGDRLSFSWDFGDGASQAASFDPTATHAYATAGTYEGTLTVSDGIRDPVSQPFTVEVIAVGQDPPADRWHVTTMERPPSDFMITIEDHGGVLVMIKEDGQNPPSLAIGMESGGVIFWMEIWMDILGQTNWGIGPVYFGTINRPAGLMSGFVFDTFGSIASFRGVYSP